MGCRGGNRWKIYRIHSFQDKFLLLVSHIPQQILQALHLSVTIFGSCSYGYRKIIVKSYHATVFFLIISHLPPEHPIISSEFKMAAVSVKRSISTGYFLTYSTFSRALHRFRVLPRLTLVMSFYFEYRLVPCVSGHPRDWFGDLC